VIAFFESIVNTLKNGDVVTPVGFGRFKVVQRKGRTGRDPQAGAEIQISASNAPQVCVGQSSQGSLELI